ncbi:hypothetical protein MASR1M60_10030 [Rhodocyclaceae bacterium]
MSVRQYGLLALMPVLMPVLMLALLLIGSGARAGTVAVDTLAERIDLADHLALLHDPDGQLHFSEVAAMATDFRGTRRADLLKRFNAGVFWLRFSLVHSGSQPITRWLAVGTPKINRITFYAHDAASPRTDGWQVLTAGRSVARQQKPVVATDAIFPITLQPGENREFLIRIDVRGASDLAATLWEPQAYRLAAGNRTLLLAFILGGTLLGGLLALVVYSRLHEPRYLWLALMLFAVSGVEAMRENLIGMYLWPGHLDLPPPLLSAFAALGIFAMAKVVTSALDLPRTIPVGNRLILALRWIAVLGLGLSFADYGAGVRVQSLTTVVLLPASLGLALIAWRKGLPSARLFTLAFALALLVETARQLANLGILPWANAMNFSMAGFLLSTPVILLGMVEQTRQLSQQLAVAEQLQAAKSTFLAKVSHELRSPLNTILGFARMLQRGSARLSLQEGTAGIEKSALRLLGLIDELLDSSRAAAGKLTVAPAPTFFIAWLDELCMSAAVAIEAKGNRFACVRNGDLPTSLTIDGPRLRQVLDNLLGNANRHTHKGEIRLECTAQTAGDQVTLHFAVRDTGEGIAPERLQSIFDPFVRGDAAEQTTDNQESRRSGFGLGLPICRELVHQMGGEITVSSQRKQGSCFSFSLECALAPPPATAAPAAISLLSQPAGAWRPRILLVDDDPQQLQLLGDLLDDAGFVTQEAGSGRAALAKLEQQRWDAVVTDQMMADGDGWFVLQQARAQAPAMPVVLLSAAWPQRPADYPAELDFAATLRKPALSEELLATLWGLILKVGAGGTAIPHAQWQVLAALAGDGDVSGIEDWIAALPASPVTDWVRAALHRLDFDLLQRSAMIEPCQNSQF